MADYDFGNLAAPAKKETSKAYDFGQLASAKAAPIAEEKSLIQDPKNLFGVGEAVLNAGSGMLAKPISDIAGLAATGKEMISPGGGDPAAFKNHVQESLTYQPRTELGKAVSAYNPVALAGKGIGKIADVAGNAVGGTGGGDTLRGAAGNLTREAIQQAPGFVAPALKEQITARTVAREAALAKEKAINLPKDTALTDAQKSGYSFPPSTGDAGPLSSFFQGIVGSTKMDYASSFKNQKVTNSLVKKELGLSGDKAITADSLSDLRDKYGNAYEAVKKAVPTLQNTPAFKAALKNANGNFAEAVKEFPEYFKNSEIDSMVKSLSKDKFTAEAAIQMHKKLRYDVNANLKAFDKPSQQALGDAQLNAARAIDDLIDQNLAMQAPPGVKNFQSKLSTNLAEARKKIAQSYAVEGALNDKTGNISAQNLGRLWEKQGNLSGGLKEVGQTYNAFPAQLRTVDKLPSTANEKISNVDVMKGTMLGAMKHGALGAVSAVARPVLAPILLSDWYQAMNVKPPAYQLGLGTRIPQAMADNPAAMFAIPRPPQEDQK